MCSLFSGVLAPGRPPGQRHALPSCNRLVYADNRPGYTAAYCGTVHQQFHLALLHTTRSLPEPTQPTTPAAAGRSTSTPAVLVCAIPSCQNPAFIDTRPGHLALCCSNRHQILYAALSDTPLCSLADCSLLVLIVTDTSTVHEYCCYDQALLARDRGDVCFSQDRPIAPAGTNACVHTGCVRKPVDFSIFCGPTHAYAHTRAARGPPPPTPPSSPPQSPRPSASIRMDARSVYPQPVTAPARFFSDVWHVSHAAWNKLQHALHGNAPPRPM